MKSFVRPVMDKISMLLIMLLLGNLAIAQDSSSTSSSTTSSKTDIKITSGQNESGDWYTSPWVWVLAALGFILLLVALLRSNSGSRTTSEASDRVTVTKTVSHDRDTEV